MRAEIFTVLAVMFVCRVASADPERTSVLLHPDFREAQEIITALVEERGDAGVNHLFVSPVDQREGGDSIAWVFWKEKRLLILWEPFEPSEWKLSGSRRILNLDKDVVPTSEDIGSSTYLVDEAWACRTIGDCVKNGCEFQITKGKKAAEPGATDNPDDAQRI